MVDERLAQQIEVLIDHPEFGRPGRVIDTRELVISKTPYLVAQQGIVRNETMHAPGFEIAMSATA